MTNVNIATRKSKDVWLIGYQKSTISDKRLPLKREMMSLFFHLHLTENMSIRESSTETAERVLEVWEKARIPTRRKQKVIEAIEKIFNEWQKLKKNKNNIFKRSKSLVEKEVAFSKALEKLFDIAHSNALSLISIPEDREFLLAQREVLRRGKMAGVDRSLAKKESESVQRLLNFEKRKEEHEREKEVLASKAVLISSSSDSSSEEENCNLVMGNENEPVVELSRKRGRKQVIDSSLASVLDRAQVSDRKATALLLSAAKTFGHDPSEFNINRSSIRLCRIEQRKNIAAEIRNQFNPTVPLIVHWDGKLLTDVTGEKVDRLPIYVTGYEVEKLLGVPKLESGTGLAIANAVIENLDRWGLSENVKGMCFDTTASNTGRKMGSCIRIEQVLEKDILYFACRHHVFELVLEAVFQVCLPPSPSPDILIFKRFKNKWTSINQEKYGTALSDEFTYKSIEDIKEEVITFAEKQLTNQQPRDDYKELLEITILFLAGTPPRGVHFLAPGAFHRARWMAKAIYAIKIWMFREQFSLSTKEETGLRDVAIFVARLYLKAWFQAPVPATAPSNDPLFLKQLLNHKTINSTVADAAIKKFSRHLWYLGEELVALAFFDRNVTGETKCKMVAALQEQGEDNVSKLATVDKDACHNKTLERFVSSNTMRFFEILGIDSNFLNLEPDEWLLNAGYLDGVKIVKSLNLVNDVAERGVALMEQYNQLHTCDEEQKQYLLQVVSEHRQRFPNFLKATLLS